MIVTKAKNLLELAESERLTTFMELVKIGGVEEAFSKFGAYTIFIPSEAALTTSTLAEISNIFAPANVYMNASFLTCTSSSFPAPHIILKHFSSLRSL